MASARAIGVAIASRAVVSGARVRAAFPRHGFACRARSYCHRGSRNVVRCLSPLLFWLAFFLPLTLLLPPSRVAQNGCDMGAGEEGGARENGREENAVVHDHQCLYNTTIFIILSDGFASAADPSFLIDVLESPWIRGMVKCVSGAGWFAGVLVARMAGGLACLVACLVANLLGGWLDG